MPFFYFRISSDNFSSFSHSQSAVGQQGIIARRIIFEKYSECFGSPNQSPLFIISVRAIARRYHNCRSNNSNYFHDGFFQWFELSYFLKSINFDYLAELPMQYGENVKHRDKKYRRYQPIYKYILTQVWNYNR